MTPSKIDAPWSCLGLAAIGGPIYCHCSRHPVEVLVIFLRDFAGNGFDRLVG